MAKVDLTKEQRAHLINIIAQYGDIGTPSNRQNFLENTGLSDATPERISTINVDGNARDFAQELVRKCQMWGTLTQTQQPALLLVIQYLCDDVVRGHEQEREFLNGLLAPFTAKMQVTTDVLPPHITPKSLSPNLEYLTIPTEEQRQLLNAMFDMSVPLPERAEAGRELARIGDPRRGVGILPNGIPDIVWCEVPGKDKGRPPSPIGGDGKIRKSQADLNTFWIAKYPLTFLQYQAFIEDHGYEKTWDGLRKKEPENQAFAFANHPRDMVTQDEVIAYCRWLSSKIGIEVRLPTEKEWEKAARGEQGYYYPWGNEYHIGYANVNEHRDKVGPYYLETTTVVGLYPQAVSPYGAQDMAGNVCEWTTRSFRGGSWTHTHLQARTTYPFPFSRQMRTNYIGARVICTSIPPNFKS